MRALDLGYQVDGQALLAPDAGVALSCTDLDSEDTGRDESGVMHRYVVREKVRTWGFSYASLTAEEYRYLVSLFAGRAVFTFTFTGEDGRAGQCTAYCSNYAAEYFNRRLGLYRNMKFDVIEC